MTGSYDYVANEREAVNWLGRELLPAAVIAIDIAPFL